MVLRTYTIRLLCAGFVFTGAVAHAQGANGDSLVARVRRLGENGSAAAGRTLADSALGAAKEGSSAYADALFARASVAESPDAARKDYLRIVVDYSGSPRAEFSLLRLAQMELARGDRASAKEYLRRLALEHPDGPSRAEGAYQLGRMMLEDGTPGPACVAFMEAKQRVAPENVELANQINYYSQPCVAAAQHSADSARADSAAKVMRADSLARDDSIAKAKAVAKKKTAAAPTKAAPKKASAQKVPAAASTAAKSGWSAQVGAYDSADEAERLAKKLKDRGYETRVSSSGKPFRVRIGWYTHRDDAAALVAKLKAAKIDAFVVEAEKP
jgi:cell division septation protein DedD